MALTCRMITLLCGLLMSATIAANDWIYTVRPGDNLHDLSEKYLIDKDNYLKIQQLNNIANPKSMPPGTVIRFPTKWLKVQPSSALVIGGKGDVTIIRSSDYDKKDESSEVRLYVGDRIITGNSSSATLIFADKSQLLLQSDSELIMDKLSVFGESGMADTQLRLPTGRVDAQVIPKKTNRSRYEITTPAAIAAVRGTKFRVNADPSGLATRSEVLKGNVEVNSETSRDSVPAGFGTVSESGKPAKKPKKLLPPPDTINSQKSFTRFPISFSWNTLPGAIQYRVQLFDINNLNGLLIDEVTTATTYSIQDLQDETYMLRVRGIDNVGLEGLNKDIQFDVNARPLAPVLTVLINAHVIQQQTPEFIWVRSDDARKYRLQLATDSQFNNIVLDKSGLVQTKYNISNKMDAGEYFWRVASLDKNSLQGPFSDTAHFIIRPALKTPKLSAPIISHDTVDFTWPATHKNAEYYFQFTSDRDLLKTGITIVTSETSLSVTPPHTGKYYYRIRTTTKDKSHNASDYSDWKAIEVQYVFGPESKMILAPVLP